MSQSESSSESYDAVLTQQMMTNDSRRLSPELPGARRLAEMPQMPPEIAPRASTDQRCPHGAPVHTTNPASDRVDLRGFLQA